MSTDTLSAAQRAAAETAAKNVLCIAGAGSGKSKTLCARIRHQVASAMDPAQIVAITFTNQAALVLKQRLPDLTLGHVGTIHSWILRLLREHGPALLGLPKRLTVLTATQAEELLAEVQAGFGGKVAKLSATRVSNSIKNEAVLAGFNRGDMSDPARLVNFEFHSRLLRDGMLSFDAILHFGFLLAERLAATKTPVCHTLLIDEYQDCSILVHQILLLLPTLSKFAVGDPDQSIMSFAGGSIQGILGLSRNPSWETHILGDNYRCGQVICDAANRLISHNKARVPKEIKAASGHASYVMEFSRADEATQTQFIVDYLKRMPPDKTAMILARTNFQVRQLSDALRAAGIQLQERLQPDLPPDWEAVRQFVAFLGQPDNDWLAYRFLCQTRSRAEANSWRQSSAEAMTSIWHRLCSQQPEFQRQFYGDVATTAARFFSRASCELLQRIVASQPGIPVAELGLALEGVGTVGQPDARIVCQTAHKAKGGEADWIFVAGLTADVWNAKPEETEENRRLLYVCLTRAREAVFLSAPRYGRTAEWQRRPSELEPSQFLGEL